MNRLTPVTATPRFGKLVTLHGESFATRVADNSWAMKDYNRFLSKITPAVDALDRMNYDLGMKTYGIGESHTLQAIFALIKRYNKLPTMMFPSAGNILGPSGENPTVRFIQDLALALTNGTLEKYRSQFIDASCTSLH